MTILKDHLPYISRDLFRELCKGTATWQLHCGPYKNRSGTADQTPGQCLLPYTNGYFFEVMASGIFDGPQACIFKSSSKYSLEIGGAMIAVVGGDGAGKSTAIDALHAWLSKNFESTKIHMGRPAWSWITIAIRSILKVGQILGLISIRGIF